MPPEISGTETLLIVENEPAIRNLLQVALRRNGYTVLAAESGREALEIVRKHDGTIHLVITDVVMPEMDGPELVWQLSTIRPVARSNLYSPRPVPSQSVPCASRMALTWRVSVETTRKFWNASRSLS